MGGEKKEERGRDAKREGGKKKEKRKKVKTFFLSFSYVHAVDSDTGFEPLTQVARLRESRPPGQVVELGRDNVGPLRPRQAVETSTFASAFALSRRRKPFCVSQKRRGNEEPHPFRDSLDDVEVATREGF